MAFHEVEIVLLRGFCESPAGHRRVVRKEPCPLTACTSALVLQLQLRLRKVKELEKKATGQEVGKTQANAVCHSPTRRSSMSALPRCHGSGLAKGEPRWNIRLLREEVLLG